MTYTRIHTDYNLALDSSALGSSPTDQQPTSRAHQVAQHLAARAPLGPAHPEETYVVLYDYAGQRNDELGLAAGQLVALVSCDEPDWWKVRTLDGSNRVGFFPVSYLAEIYDNERPLQVVQTIQVSDGETCEKLLRGQVSS